MLYFDERKVSRKYDVSFHNSVLQWWRNDPGFSQKFTFTFTDNNTIVSKGQMRKDAGEWEDDLQLTYKRVK